MTGKEQKPTGSRKMPARASRPRDFGAPEPKPSRKVALDEVLRTLQDLVGNELNVEAPQKTKPEKKRNASAAGLPAETPDEIAAVSDATTDLEIVAEALPEPVTEIELTALEPEPPTAIAVPPEGLQQELPNLDPGGIGTGLPEPEPAPAIVAQDLEPIVTELPELEIAPVAETAPAPAPAPTASDHNHTPTDIPVLSDVVDEIEEVEAVALPADEVALPGRSMSAPPPPADARKLAIQVAARLNVELRKAGKPGLSSDVIARLAHALEEALAKAASNGENKAS